MMTDIPVKPSEADVTLFLAFLDDQRAYHDQRIKDFPPEDALMQAIHKAHSAALDAMTAMAGANIIPARSSSLWSPQRAMRPDAWASTETIHPCRF